MTPRTPAMRRMLFLAGALLLAGPLAAQPASAPGEEAVIRRIRAAYAATNAALPGCARREHDLGGRSAEGGSLEVYACGGSVARLVATLYGETGKRVDEIYVAAGRPYFVFRVQLRYERPFGRVASRREDRFYFDGDRLVRWAAPGARVPPSSPEARAEAGELLAWFGELMAVARAAPAPPER